MILSAGGARGGATWSFAAVFGIAVAGSLAACVSVAPVSAASRLPAGACASPAEEVVARGPTVVAFWLVPLSDSILLADPEFASGLDDQAYYWAEGREKLAAAGITALTRPGVCFPVREAGGRWMFTAHPDSAPIGYLVLSPGRQPVALYKRRFADELVAAVRQLHPRDTRTEPP